MATTRQYATQLWQRAVVIGPKFGIDVAKDRAELRVILRMVIIMIAPLVKLLFDKGVFTDQELLSYYDVAAADDYVPEPNRPDTGT